MTRPVAWLLLVTCTLAAVEGAAWLSGRFLASKGVLYRPPAEPDLAGYLARRDPVLGWPPPGDAGGPTLDRTGARRSPAFPEPGDACLSLYGDSFTYGAEVEHSEAWADRLARALGCRVANYGVRAYGTDQAVLRFERNETDEAPAVVLGFMPENILRNVNRIRALLQPDAAYGWKPRFVLESDGLRLLPLPPVDVRPDRIEHDYFAVGGPSGLHWLAFPYTLSVLRSFGQYRIRAELRRELWYADFYDAEHPSGALEVTARIVERFRRVSEARGKQAFAIVLPNGRDLEHYRRTGVWVFEPLIERLARGGIELYNLGPDLLDGWEGRDPCDLFGACGAHFNALGNARVARVVERYLSRRGVPGVER